MRISMIAYLVALCLVSSPGIAQELTEATEAYQTPRTEHGYPDLQGVWMTSFSTMLQRPPNVQALVITQQAAEMMRQTVFNTLTAGVTDPEFGYAQNITPLQVNGEYRSSIIVQPANGQIPFNENGRAISMEAGRLLNEGLNGPEQRPLEERCLASMGYPPIRSLPFEFARTIVQTEDYLVFFSEDSAGLRLIHIDTPRLANTQRSFSGYSNGRWENDSLVVTTDHFRGDFPARLNPMAPVLIGANTTVIERFTRTAEDKLHYYYTVTDPDYYSEPWSGEFVFKHLGGGTYEYGCHEGNYSLPSVLKGGIVQALDAEFHSTQ